MFCASSARWLSLSTILASAGCATNSAPKDWLPKPAEAQADVYGGWIQLTYKEGDGKRQIDGELIAVSDDSVWVLSQDQGLAVATANVENGKLTAYAAQTGGLTRWTLLGALSTISNGILLVFTAPLWLIVGGSAISSESGAAQRKNPPLTWVELAPFARFPQGLPEGIELAGLQAKKINGPLSRTPLDQPQPGQPVPR